MLEQVFQGVFDSSTTSVIEPQNFLLCVFVSLAIGFVTALMYTYRSRCTRSFVATLALMPAVVCVVIMMVNGNVGTGVAVAGAFSLVRFRSAPGTAREIGAIFLAMGAGLICGMGYLAYAALFAVLLSAVSMLYNRFAFGERRTAALYRTLHITIPEDLDYTGVFDGMLKKYTTEYELTQVKTTNMGSLFRLTCDLTLRGTDVEKDLIDELRCRNGNLEISVSRQQSEGYEL